MGIDYKDLENNVNILEQWLNNPDFSSNIILVHNLYSLVNPDIQDLVTNSNEIIGYKGNECTFSDYPSKEQVENRFREYVKFLRGIITSKKET